MSGPEFSWAVLPTWRGRYPPRYVGIWVIVLVTIVWLPSGPRWLFVGLGVLGAVLAVDLGRRELVVTAGRFHGWPALRGLASDDVLDLAVHRGWWGRYLRLTTVAGRRVMMPPVSWKVWPVRDFDEQVRGLRRALGMPADPPPDLG